MVSELDATTMLAPPSGTGVRVGIVPESGVGVLVGVCVGVLVGIGVFVGVCVGVFVGVGVLVGVCVGVLVGALVGVAVGTGKLVLKRITLRVLPFGIVAFHGSFVIVTDFPFWFQLPFSTEVIVCLSEKFHARAQPLMSAPLIFSTPSCTVVPPSYSFKIE